jgi:hypothetical protein
MAAYGVVEQQSRSELGSQQPMRTAAKAATTSEEGTTDLPPSIESISGKTEIPDDDTLLRMFASGSKNATYELYGLDPGLGVFDALKILRKRRVDQDEAGRYVMQAAIPAAERSTGVATTLITPYVFTIEERIWGCSHCRATFGHKRAYDEHLQSHNDPRSRTCPHCDKVCSTQSILTVHLQLCRRS